VCKILQNAILCPDLGWAAVTVREGGGEPGVVCSIAPPLAVRSIQSFSGHDRLRKLQGGRENRGGHRVNREYSAYTKLFNKDEKGVFTNLARGYSAE